MNGKPLKAWNVRSGDNRVFCLSSHPWRRRADPVRRWIAGSLDVRDDDLVFIDSLIEPQTTYRAPLPSPRFEEYELYEALSADDAFLADLRDEECAHAAYWVLFGDIVRTRDRRYFQFHDEEAANFIAEVADSGDEAIDFRYSDTFRPYKADAIERITSHLTRLGWHSVNSTLRAQGFTY